MATSSTPPAMAAPSPTPEQARYDDNSERYAATRADLEIEASCAYGYDDHDDACASLNAGSTRFSKQ